MTNQELLAMILSRAEEAITALEIGKSEDRNITNAWRKIKQIRHAIKENGGYKVDREGYNMSDVESALCDKEEKHESFGTLSISNISGNMRLVGTTTEFLPNSVRLTIHRSKRIIDGSLHTEYFMPIGRPLVQIEMSRNQWAEAICSQSGIGVPVTVRTVMGTDMEDVPNNVRSPFQQIIDDAKKSARHRPKGAEHFKKQVDELAAAVENMGLPKGKAATIANTVRSLYNNNISAVVSASAWAAERLNEEAEKAVSQAKVEVAGSIQSIINQAGLKALGIEENFTPRLRGVDKKEDE